MDITDVKIRLVSESDQLVKANVSITLGNSLAVHDILVIDGKNGLFVAMPSRRCSDGIFRDVVHPINQSSRAEIAGVILQAYRREHALAQMAGKEYIGGQWERTGIRQGR